MKNKITIYLAMITIVLLASGIIVYLSQDHIAPEIIVPETEMTYIEGQDNSILLIGVTATDNKDDNLSPDIRIYDVAVLDNGIQALVTYAVYDHSNNLGKATKLVNYMADPNMPGAVSTDTEEDDGLSDAEDESDIDDENTTEDSKKDEEETTEQVEEGYDEPELVSHGAPVIRLTTHEVHIGVGDYFYSMDYVEDAVDDIDSREYLYRNMFLDSWYDEYTPGEYELLYYCVDSNGNRSNDAKLMLYVEEEQSDE